MVKSQANYMNLRAQISLVISVAVLFCAVIGFVTYTLDRSHVADRMREFQDTQRAAVNQIAERVRWQFQKLHDALYSLSQIPNVQFTEENEALLHLIRAYRMNEDLVDGIFRVEKTGNTLLAYPTTAAPLPAGDLQPVLREARLTGKTAHQVLTLRDGASQVLAIAKPVYTIQGEAHTYPNNKFAGLLIFTISLDRLNRNILDLPAFGPSGFFLVTTDRGIIVGAERGTLLGRSAEDLAKNYPRFAKADFLRILARMRNGETGDDTYSHPMGPGFPDLVVNQYSRYSVSPGDATDDRGMRDMESRRAAFTALMLGDDRWSVAVFSPERDVTLLIEKSIGDRWLVTAAFIATMAVMTALIIILIRKNHAETLAKVTRAAQELQERKTQLANAQRIAKVGHWQYQSASKTTSISDSLYRILGFRQHANNIAYRDFLRMLRVEERREIRDAVFEAIKAKKGCSFEHWIVGHDAKKRYIRQEVEIRCDQNGFVRHIAGIAQDVTERRMAEERIRELAYFDPVTGLPNRTYLKELMGRWVQNAARFKRMLAVLFLDLDNFKCVNDTLGHDVGDMLLREVGARLIACVRSGDLTSRPSPEQKDRIPVTRLGGDEFVIVLSEIQRSENAAEVALRVAEALSTPLAVGNNEITLTASIGVAVFPDDGESAETLLKNADVAMYQAKSNGRNGYAFYTKSLHDKALRRVSLEADLRKAIKREEFLVYLQPKLDVRRPSIVGAEALLRWQHPRDGLVPPGEFVALAEDTGLIVPIGNWVLREACQKAAGWQASNAPRLKIAVNVSAAQFKQRGFVPYVEEVLRDTGLPPDCLELELTETLLMANTEASVITLNELAALGVSVAIDDFGTGYSSLSYLKRFPLTALKIDRSFIRDIPNDPDDAAIVNATIALAHSLRLRATAEGVETSAQLEFLQRARCDEIQGYLIGRPMPEEDFRDWITQHRLKARWLNLTKNNTAMVTNSETDLTNLSIFLDNHAITSAHLAS